MTDPVVWEVGDAGRAELVTTRFMEAHSIADYATLLDRSRAEPEWFWGAVVEFLGIPFSTPYDQVMDVSDGPEWARWFDGGTINLSEACVDRWLPQMADETAVVTEREDGVIRRLTFGELHEQVERLAGALAGLGATQGSVVAVFLPMTAEAVVALLAVARIGAVFVPIFSGYGAEAVASRLDDPRPDIVVCADGSMRRGSVTPMKEIADEAIRAVGGVAAVICLSHLGRPETPMTPGRDHWWHEVVPGAPRRAAAPTPSETPVLLAYTSGTTGRPKGAVHTHGGFTVKVVQEGAFQSNFQPGDRVMWSTDMGWIMGPWIVVAGLGNGATVVTYDGAPDQPGPDRLFELAARHRLAFLGISPTFVRAIQRHGVDAIARHDLTRLAAFGSTGEPWNPDPWWWLFRDVGGERIPIVNISGGTEIGACILAVNLLQGIKPTSVGGPALGMAAAVLDPDGSAVTGEVGELAVTAPWPGMTRGFWGDPERYLSTYWSRFDGIWVHGDWASIDADGFWYLHGRSDDTLNVAGKRVGPAEIESAAVELPEIVMAAAVGIPHPVKGETIAVYVVTHEPVEAAELGERVADQVATRLGASFRPSHVRVAADLPRTRSAKIIRRAVKALALGEDPGDLSSLENPESLDSIEPLR